MIPTDDFLMKDSELERIWDDLRQELKIARDVDLQFLTWIKPSGMEEINGVYRAVGKKACFEVVSPNPNDESKPPIRTFGSTPLKSYRAALKDSGHYVGRSHPAKTIFAHLVRAHLKAIGAISGLDPVDEATYYRNLDTARWLVEQAQGKRFEAGVTMY